MKNFIVICKIISIYKKVINSVTKFTSQILPFNFT